ncbi:MAG: helix-turn-helix domain-containing protein [Flammeovirgaceae bacterium]
MPKLCDFSNPFNCPVTATMQIIGGRWKPIIIYCLSGGKKRFGQIGAMIPSISKKILTEQLKELENDGLILRTAYNEIPPKVEYSLTEKGESLLPILKEMSEWGKKYVLMNISH